MFACAKLSLHDIHTQSKFHTSKSSDEYDNNLLVVCPQVVKSNRHLHVATLVRRLERGATRNLGSHTLGKPEQT